MPKSPTIWAECGRWALRAKAAGSCIHRPASYRLSTHMLRHFLLLAAVSVPGLSAAVTYTFTGPNYSLLTPFTSCTIGSCANFTTSMNVQGSFTTSVPLAANLTFQDISTQILSYSFTDGIDTFTNTDPNTRISFFTVSTDAFGRFTSYAAFIQVWVSGTSPRITPPTASVSFSFTSNRGATRTQFTTFSALIFRPRTCPIPVSNLATMPRPVPERKLETPPLSSAPRCKSLPFPTGPWQSLRPC